MRSPTRALGLLVATFFGLIACSSDTITDGSLGFTVAESILVLEPDNATIGYAVLSGGTGTCAALQSGVTIIPAQVGGLDYVYILLGQLDASANLLPLAAGSYTIINPTDPNSSFTPPGLLANAVALGSDSSCLGTPTFASSGTATVVPFDSSDGGSSTLNYTAVFGSTRVTGTYVLTTCLVPSTTALADAGTCVECVGGTPDGGACAIP
jgi:hypothetical protein